MPKARPWTPAEDEFIAANHHEISVSAIGAQLNRPKNAVSGRLNRLGLCRSRGEPTRNASYKEPWRPGRDPIPSHLLLSDLC